MRREITRPPGPALSECWDASRTHPSAEKNWDPYYRDPTTGLVDEGAQSVDEGGDVAPRDGDHGAGARWRAERSDI